MKSLLSDNAKKVSLGLMALFLFSGCMGADRPFTMGESEDDSLVKNPPPANGGTGGTDGDNNPNPNACKIFLENGELQLQISSPGSVGDVVDTGFYPVPLIPFEFNGTEVTLRGSEFPSFLPYLGDADANYDLVLRGDATNVAKGTYDPATGKLDIKDFKFLAEVYSDGGAYGTPLAELTNIPPVDWTTDPGQVAKGSGNIKEITIDGAAVNNSDPQNVTVSLAVVVTLPEDLGGNGAANNALGGAALSALFRGNLTQDPSSCSGDGGVDPGNGGVPGIGPSEFKLILNEGIGGIVGDTVDFGRTEVVTSTSNGTKILNCSDVMNRGIVYKTAKITNTSGQPLVIKGADGFDTDADNYNDMGCLNDPEFHSYGPDPKLRPELDKVEVEAECEKTMQGNPKFPCTVPKDGVLRFTTAYMPKNYVAPMNEDEPVKDTGELRISYGENQLFAIKTTGYVEPSTKGAFKLSKVAQDNTVSIAMSEGETVKISTPNKVKIPQKVRLFNYGDKEWTILSVSIQYQDDAQDSDKVFTYTDQSLSSNTLSAAMNEDTPGSVDFEIAFDPQVDVYGYDKASIKVEMSGDRVLLFPLFGSVGEPILDSSQVSIRLDISYIGAYINSLVGAVFSADFRLEGTNPNILTEIPPKDIELEFSSAKLDDPIKSVKFLLPDVNMFDDSSQPNLYDLPNDNDPQTLSRPDIIRVFNAQGSTSNGKGEKAFGDKLGSLDPATWCNEPNNIKNGYVEGDCAYFYFKIIQEPDDLGVYDSDTGNLIFPNLIFEMNNPHHDLTGFFKTGPLDEVNNAHVKDTLKIALSTFVLDDVKKDALDKDGKEKTYSVITDDRISISDLNVAGKVDAGDCPAGYFHNDEQLLENWPTVKCYVNKLGLSEYFYGTPVKYVGVSKDDPTEKVYDVVLVGVTRFSDTDDPNVPVYLKDNNGYLMYLAIHGQLKVKPK